MTRKITIAFLLLSMFFGFQATAQSDAWTTPVIEDEMTKDPEQNAQWRTGDATFSAKPKNAWEVGLHLGNFMVNGDVATNPFGGLGLGMHIRRAISYTFSVRLDLMYGQYKAYDVRGSNRSVLSVERFYREDGDRAGARARVDAYGNEAIYRNFETKVFGGSLQAVINLGNILFHQERNKWGMYGLVGLGLYAPDVKLNLANGNSAYDFNGALGGLDATKQADRKEIRNRIKDLLDDSYETDGGVENRVAVLGDDKDIIPSIHLGIGFSRKLGKRVNLTLEHQAIFSDNDLLDGYEYRTSVDETNNLDLMNYTSLRININLGNFDKRTEPLYWLNPLAPAMNEIKEAKDGPEFDLTDTDGDGVIDMLDAELNSPAGCAVDTRGVVLDSDGDGLIDCKDQEKYSPPGYPINDVGVAQIPKSPSLTEDDVNAIVNNKLSNLPQREWWLPMIHFDLDKYYVKPEFYAHMQHVARVLEKNPDVKMLVIGHTDVRNPGDYNRVLSYNRSKAAINYLVTKYGIDPDRLILQYGGEDQPLVDGLPESHAIPRNKEVHQYLNRRVEFRVAEPGDEPMGRPEGPEAGQGTPGSARPGSKFSGNSNSGY